MFEPEDQSIEGYIAEFRREMEFRKTFSQALMVYAATERLRKDLLNVSQVQQVKQPFHERLVEGVCSVIQTLVGGRRQTPPAEKGQRIDLEVDTFYIVREDGTVQPTDETETRKEKKS